MLCKQSFLFNGIVLKFNSEFQLTGQLIIQKPFYFKGIALSPQQRIMWVTLYQYLLVNCMFDSVMCVNEVYQGWK